MDSVWLGLACTCVHFGGDQVYMLVDASFSPLGHTMLVNASFVAYFKYSIATLLHI